MSAPEVGNLNLSGDFDWLVLYLPSISFMASLSEDDPLLRYFLAELLLSSLNPVLFPLKFELAELDPI